jgi:peptidoglycan/LPS O-acetylase OafA/YrhL
MKGKESMKIFDILNPFFHALSDGKLIRLTVAWVLRILAVIMALVGLLGFIAIIALGFKASEGTLGTHAVGYLIGCIILALFALAWGYLQAGILTFRARSVQELGDSHFTVLSILSLLFRLNGELAFVTYSLLGVGGCLFIWFTDANPFSQLGMLGESLPFASRESSGFLGGIEMAVLFLLIAFFFIVLFYALAELSVVLVEIALNTRGLRKFAVEAVPAPAPQPDAAFTPARSGHPPAIASMQRTCKKCGQTLDAGSTFCDECGTQVG